MTLIVETGQGVADANSYIELTYADTYHSVRGNADWAAASEAARTAALIRATEGIDAKYAEQWLGVKAKSGQSLAWPRAKVIDTTQPIVTSEGESIAVDSIPKALKQATAEVALIELTTRFVQRTVSRDNLVKREKVDVIETEYFAGAPSVTLYPHVDALLKGIASSALNTLGMIVGITEYERAEIERAESGELEYLSDSRYFLQQT